jgi:hypothetical protein
MQGQANESAASAPASRPRPNKILPAPSWEENPHEDAASWDEDDTDDTSHDDSVDEDDSLDDSFDDQHGFCNRIQNHGTGE